MDLRKYDSRTASETATFCHWRAPQTGELLYTENGDPIGAMVIGFEARSVHAAIHADNVAKLKAAASGTKEEMEQASKDIQQNVIRDACLFTKELVNVVVDGKIRVAPDDCEMVYDLNFVSIAAILNPDEKKWQKLSFAQQVQKHGTDMAHYLGND